MSKQKRRNNSNSSENGEEVTYFMHLKHLAKIEQRENNYPTYPIKFKSQQKQNELSRLKEKIKENNQLLRSQSKDLKNQSKIFSNQFNFIRELERKRLKEANKKLKEMVQNAQTERNLHFHSFSKSNEYFRGVKKSKKRMHSLPYMRFANAYPL